MSPSDLTTEIARLMETQLGISVPSSDADLLGSGLLDSLSFVELLASLESKYGVKIDIAALELDDLRSIDKISQFLSGVIKQAS